MTDLEIIELKIGGVTIKDMSSITFLSWVATKLNNIDHNTGNRTVNELNLMVMNPPMGKLAEGTKVEVYRKLEKLGVV